MIEFKLEDDGTTKITVDTQEWNTKCTSFRLTVDSEIEIIEREEEKGGS